MSEEQKKKGTTVSVSISTISGAGFPEVFCIETDSLLKLLDHIGAVEQALLQADYSPPRRRPKGAKKDPLADVPEETDQRGHIYKTCPIHGTQMPKRSKNGQTWFSHQLPDGTWCKGSANN